MKDSINSGLAFSVVFTLLLTIVLAVVLALSPGSPTPAAGAIGVVLAPVTVAYLSLAVRGVHETPVAGV
jgi:hypothetical protein